MLSKAAFNAFLKILEEPPATVVFMLATTDPHKIIETVSSRCFHLFFDPIKNDDIVQHLEFICAEESLTYERDALSLIAYETGGSMRDALNLVERLRIAYTHITKQAVIELLGSIDEDRLCELLEIVLQGDPEQILAACSRLELAKYSPQIVWKKLVELTRLSLWAKHAVSPDDSAVSAHLKTLVLPVSYKQLIVLLEHWYSYEPLFAKTAIPSTMLEMMLLSVPTISPSGPHIEKTFKGATPSKTVPQQPAPEKAVVAKKIEVQQPRESSSTPEPAPDPAQKEPEPAMLPDPTPESPWEFCLREIEKMSEPLVVSIFKQGSDEKYDPTSNKLEIVFPKELVFFKDWLSNTQRIWQPLIEQFFAPGTELVPHFTGQTVKERPLVKVAPVALVTTEQAQNPQPPAKVSTPVRTPRAVNNRSALPKVPTGRTVTTVPESWEKSHMILRTFPGTITVVHEEEGGT